MLTIQCLAMAAASGMLALRDDEHPVFRIFLALNAGGFIFFALYFILS